MIDIIVIRGVGDNPGEDIIEPLLATVNVALARGQAEIDTHSDLQTVILQVLYRGGVERGQLVEVQDSLQGVVWRGKIQSIEHVISGGTVHTELTVVRPVEFNPE